MASDRQRRALLRELIEQMRRTNTLTVAMAQSAADRVGLNPTHLNCLNLLSLDGPLTPGQLADATGLTTASITAVLDRLEELGYVRRERDTADRRRVLVHLEYGPVEQRVAAAFTPLIRSWSKLVAGYSEEQLRLLLDFFRANQDVMAAELAALRAGRTAGRGAGRTAGRPRATRAARAD